MKKIRYFILAVVGCMLMSMPVQAMAASLNYVFIQDVAFKDFNESESIFMSVNDEYISTGYPEAGTYQLYKKDGHVYGIYHIKHVFSDILYTQLDFKNVDAFVLESFDTVNRNINVSLGLFGAESYEVDIANIEKYAEINAGGEIYKADFNYLDVFIDKPRLGPIIIYPVVEFDIIVDMEYSSLETEVNNSFTVMMTCSSSSTSPLKVYGANYISTGENGIISNIQTFGQNIIYNIQDYGASIIGNIQDYGASIISNIQRYGQLIIDNVITFKNELFTKLDDIFSTDSTVISGAMDDYQSAEQEVFAPAMDSLTDFDFGSNDISSLGTGFIGAITFVSSCLSNMYDLTPFSAVFDVIATLALASICIGMSRLWFGKKGR